MNRIASEKEALAIQLFLNGYSSRMVSIEIGIHKNTAWTLGKRLKESYGTVLCQCGKVAGHKGWCGFRMSVFGMPWKSQLANVSVFNIYIPTRPRYERPDIPGERETEIPLLVNRRGTLSLDAPVFDGDDSGHTFFNSQSMTPLEILMLKEDYESAEHQQRLKSVDEFNKWTERRQSAFQITP